MNPFRSKRPLESIEAEYLGSAAEKPKKAPRTSDDVVRDYMGDAYSADTDEPKKIHGVDNSAFVFDKDGNIAGFKEDEQFVTLKEANRYLADQYADLSHDIEMIRTSGLPEKTQAAELKKIAAREAELKKFSNQVVKAEKDPASREAGYEGSEYLIENPEYRPGTTYQEEMNPNLETSEEEEEITRVMKKAMPESPEDQMNLEGRRRGVDELYKIRNRLVNERDAVMWELKYGGHKAEDLIKDTLNEMKKTRMKNDPSPEPIYPAMFPPETPEELERRQTQREVSEFDEEARSKKQRPVIRKEAMGKQAAADYLRGKGESLGRLREYPVTDEGEAKRAKGAAMIEISDELETDLAKHKHQNIGEALREILDELDEVQEDIIAAERNLRFVEQRTGKKGGASSKKKAA